MWGTAADGDNIVWGTDCGGDDCDTVVWGTQDGDNIVWGTAADGDNIVWGTAADGDNIVWGTRRRRQHCLGDRKRGEHRVADLQGGQVVMEKMPYRDELQQAVVLSTTETVVSTDWRQGLPTLRGRQVVLRELRASDARVALRAADHRGSGAFHLPAAEHG